MKQHWLGLAALLVAGMLWLGSCDSAKKQKKGIYELDLSRRGLDKLPDEVGEYVDLETLYADENKLAELSTQVENLKNLRELIVANNQMGTLPDWIAQLEQLEKLDLSNNQFKELPMVVTKISHLSHLDLRHNQLTTLPKEIGNLKQLNAVYLAGNNFSEEQRRDFRKWLPRTKFIWTDKDSLLNK